MYTLREMQAVLNFTVTRTFDYIPLNMPQMIMDETFVDNWQFSSKNPNFYFKYMYMFGKIYVWTIVVFLIVYFIGRKIGYNIIPELFNLILGITLLEVVLS